MSFCMFCFCFEFLKNIQITCSYYYKFACLKKILTKYYVTIFFYKNVFKLRCTLLRLYSNADSIILFSPGCETFHVLSI